MARKSHDMAMLLASRGRSRSRGGLGHVIIGYFDRLIGRSSSSRSRMRDERRGQSVSIWALLGAVLVAFAGGFLLGGRLAPKSPAGGEALNAGGAPGRSAGFVGEIDTQMLSRECFVVALYPTEKFSDAEARTKATDLATWLRSHGIAKARPYRFPTSTDATMWGVACYYDGKSEENACRERLIALPDDSGDEMFAFIRKTATVWPRAHRFE